MVDTDWRRTCGRQHPSGRVGTAGLPRALKRPKLQETAAGLSQPSAPLCGALRYQSHTGAISTSITPYKRGFNRGTPGGQPYGPGVTPLASPSPCRFAADNASHRRPSSDQALVSPQSHETVLTESQFAVTFTLLLNVQGYGLGLALAVHLSTVTRSRVDQR